MLLKLFGYSPKNSKLAGDTQDKDMAKKKAFDLINFSLGAMNEIDMTPGRAMAGAAVFAPVSIVKTIDGVSTRLFQLLATGEHIDQLVIEARRQIDKGTVEYLKYDLRMVLVSNVFWAASEAADGISEQEERVELEFGALEVSYTMPDDKTGKPGKPQTAAWSVVKNNASLKV